MRNFERLPGIAFGDRDEGYVVRRAGRRHRKVDHFGLHGKTYRCEKYALGGLCYIGILHGRHADHRSGIYGIAPVRNGSNVETRIEIRQRVEARVVAESPLDDRLLRRIDIPFDYEVAILRHPQLVRQTLDQPYGTAAQKAGQQILVHIVGHRRRSRVGIYRVAAQSHRDGHTPSQTTVCVEVARTGLMSVPVHARSAGVEYLHAVHAHVGYAALGVDRMHHRQRDERPSVAAPRRKRRQTAEVDIVAQHDRLLALSARR